MWPTFWRSFNIYSLEGFKYLNDQLEEYQTINTLDAGFVETLRLVAEVVTYGDQHDPSIFEFFMEKQVMAQFLNILKMSNNPDVALQLLQTLNIMIQSLESEHAIYYLFSNEYINNLITYPFDFQNEELVLYYISFLRTISGKLDKNTISLLVKTQHDAVVSFPLYSEAIKFVDHQDNMIRIAVRALTLSIHRVNDNSVNEFITKPPMSGFFLDLVKCLKQKIFKLDTLVRVAQVDGASEITKTLVSTVEEIEDDFYYLCDILCAGVSTLSGLVTQCLLDTLVLPELLPALNASHSNSTQITTLTSLYVLSRLLQVVSNKELVNSVAAALLHPPMVASTSFSPECNGHSKVEGLPIDGTKSVEAPIIPVVSNSTESKEQQSQHNDVQSLETKFSDIVLLEESDKRRKSNSSSVLLSLVSCENYKLILASLSLLVLLLQSKELNKSLLDGLRVLPHSMQCKNLSQVLDALIRLICSRPLCAEAMWHVGWLFKNMLPFVETKFDDHRLNVAYMNACNKLLNEINDSCCDLIPKALLSEWKDCKKVVEAPAVQKDIKFVLLPDSEPLVPDGSSSFFVRERMLGAIKVFVLFRQVMNLFLKGTLLDIPHLDLLKELPTSSRAKGSGLDNVALRVGVEVNLGDAVPCRIAFQEGKEMHFYMLPMVKGAYGWLVLAEDVLPKIHYGVVFAFAPLASLKPKVDEIHSRWLHLLIRTDNIPPLRSEPYRTKQVPDGRWTLAFSDEETCKYANFIIHEEMEIQRSFVRCAIEPLLEVDVGMKIEGNSLSSLSNIQTENQ